MMAISRLAQREDPITQYAPQRITVTAAIELVKAHPGHTSAELASKAGAQRADVARRLTDTTYQTHPPVKRGQVRACSVTGRQAITWWPNPEARA